MLNTHFNFIVAMFVVIKLSISMPNFTVLSTKGAVSFLETLCLWGKLP